MKSFFATIAVGLILVAAFNYKIDPFNRFHDLYINLQNNIQPDEVVTFSGEIDDRLQKRSQIKFLKDINLLILGSSRSLQIRSSLFKPELKFYNGSLLQGIFLDYAAVWENFRKNNLKPAKIIIFVDPWQFNVTFNQSVRAWESLGTDVQDFLKLKLQIPEKPTEPSAISYLWSLDTLKSSYTIAQEQGLLSAQRFLKIQKSAKLGSGQGIHADGSYTLPEASRSTLDSGDNPDWVNQSMITRPSSKANIFEPDTEAAQIFTKLLDDMISSGAQILVVTAPIHPLAWDIVQNKIKTGQIYTDEQKMLSDILKPRRQISYCNLLHESPQVCSAGEFIGAIHLTQACEESVLKSCAQGPFHGIIGQP